jgi:hypothetical protein
VPVALLVVPMLVLRAFVGVRADSDVAVYRSTWTVGIAGLFGYFHPEDEAGRVIDPGEGVTDAEMAESIGRSLTD